MSEETVVTPEPIVEPTPAPVDAPIELPADHPLVKTLAAQKETIKELKGKASRLDEIEEAQKTELQKAQERAEAAEQALADIEAKEALAALVAEVADAKKVPAAVLRGATREELEAHADTYLASLPVIPNAPSADGLGPVGGTVTGSDEGIDAAIAAAEAARNFPLAITLKQRKLQKKG
jgi:hypothetical protein